MPTRGKLVTLWFGGLAALGLGLGVFLSRQALLELWYLRQLESDDASDRISAIHVLGEMRSREAAKRLLRFLVDEDRPEFFEALRAFAKIGPRAAEAAPKLVEAYFVVRDTFDETEDTNPTVAVRQALVGIGSPSVAPLIIALQNAVEEGYWSNGKVRRKFSVIFKSLGRDAAEALLDALAQSPDLGITVEDCVAAQGLSALPLLIERLRSNSPSDQLWAANIAWELAATHAEGVRAIADARLDSREPLRSRLLHVLDLTTDFGRNVLLEAQGSGDVRTRRAAQSALDALTGE